MRKKNTPRILQRNSKIFMNIKMVEYIEYNTVNVKLSDSQQNKLK